MSIAKSEFIFSLVKSLSKSEKKSFRLYAERIQESDQLLYMQLFDLYDKQKKLNEQEVKSKLGNISSTNYANVKRHLYEQILTSLRLINKNKKSNIKLSEMIDFAYILYGKGLYMQSLKILEKAKKFAKQHNRDISILNIIEIEKMIHSRHITRSKAKPIDNLLEEAAEKSETIYTVVKLSNLKIALHKFYIEKGHVRNKKEETSIIEYFAKHLPDIPENALDKMERIYLYQSYVWYYYILNDFSNCSKYALKWLNIYEKNKDLQARDVNLYFRAYHYLLTSYFNKKNIQQYVKYHAEIEQFRKQNYNRFNQNTKIISFLYVHSARLNMHILRGSYTEARVDVKKTLARLHRYKSFVDEHKVMVFYFKIAWIYLASGNPSHSIKYLQEIINMTNKMLRLDIQTYARLMFLMVHYELDNTIILPSMIKKYKRFFEKHKINNKIQLQFLEFFSEILKAPLLERKKVTAEHIQDFKKLETNRYEKRTFLYLDFVTWLKAIHGKTSIEKLS
jgi:tRNA U34 5-methylaminomethyl-2-thiouridine-forming methyltransferase MnmC